MAVGKCWVFEIANIGGMIGHINGTIGNSYSTGQVTGNNTAGGFVGYSIGGTIVIPTVRKVLINMVLVLET